MKTSLLRNRILALPCREGKESVAKYFFGSIRRRGGAEVAEPLWPPTETLQQPFWAINLKCCGGISSVESVAMMLPLSANSLPHDSALILPERQARWPKIKPHDAASRPT